MYPLAMIEKLVKHEKFKSFNKQQYRIYLYLRGSLM